MFWRRALGVREGLEVLVKYTEGMIEDEKWGGGSEMIDGRTGRIG